MHRLIPVVVVIAFAAAAVDGVPIGTAAAQSSPPAVGHIGSTQQSPALFPILENGSWGLIDQTGKVVVAPRFPALRVRDDLRLRQFTVLNEPVLVQIGKKCGYIDRGGRFVLEPQAEEALQSSEGLAAVKVADKWGYIDKSGKFSIAPAFDGAEQFSEGRAAVKIGRAWGYIDPSGAIVIKPQFDGAGYFREAIARVSIGFHQQAYIDTEGRFLVSPHNIKIFRSSTQLTTPVEVGKRRGYWTSGGDLIVEPLGDEPRGTPPGLPFAYRPDGLQFFSHGLAVVATSDGTRRSVYIDRSGKEVFSVPSYYAYDFSEGLAVVKVGDRWGYIDRTGSFAIKPQFEAAGRFSEGLASVRIGSLDGYIDRSGAVAVPPRFNSAGAFSHGLAKVTLDRQWGYIDRSGKFVWGPTKPQYGSIQLRRLPYDKRIQVPPGFADLLDRALKAELAKSGMFEQVRGEDEAVDAADASRSLVLEYGFVEFNVKKLESGLYHSSSLTRITLRRRDNETVLDEELGKNQGWSGEEKQLEKGLPENLAWKIVKEIQTQQPFAICQEGIIKRSIYLEKQFPVRPAR